MRCFRIIWTVTCKEVEGAQHSFCRPIRRSIHSDSKKPLMPMQELSFDQNFEAFSQGEQIQSIFFFCDRVALRTNHSARCPPMQFYFYQPACLWKNGHNFRPFANTRLRNEIYTQCISMLIFLHRKFTSSERKPNTINICRGICKHCTKLTLHSS